MQANGLSMECGWARNIELISHDARPLGLTLKPVLRGKSGVLNWLAFACFSSSRPIGVWWPGSLAWTKAPRVFNQLC